MFRPDLNAQRMHDSCERLEMPPFPVDKFVQAVADTVKANAAWVPPFGSGATLYIRPYMFGSNPVIGVKPADEYQFRILTTPVGPYFKGGAKPLTIKVSDFDRAAPHGTGHIKAGLNYAMSLHAIMLITFCVFRIVFAHHGILLFQSLFIPFLRHDSTPSIPSLLVNCCHSQFI